MAPGRFSSLNFSYFRMWREAFAYATRRQKIIVAMYHVVFVGASAVSLQIPYLVGKLVNILQAGGPALLADSAHVLLLIVLCNFSLWALHGPARVVERRMAREIYVQFMESAYARIAELPLSWHQNYHSGGTINRVSTAGLGLQTFIGNGYVSVANLSQLSGSIIMLLLFNVTVGALSLAGFVVAMLVVVALNHKMIRALRESNEAAHQANATFYDFVGNIVSIIILRLQKFSEATLRRKLDLGMAPWMTQVKVNEFRWFVYSMLNTSITAAILLGFIYAQVHSGLALSAGALVTVYLYQSRIGEQGFGFLGIHGDWLGALANMEAARTIFDDHARLVRTDITAPPADWRALNLQHVDFSYGDKRGALSDIAIDIKRGEKIALIGGSGAGKSTLLSLLRGMHAPQRAEAAIDGTPFPFGVLAQMTTLIPQDPEIFENTIRFNVSFGLDVPDAAVMEALEMAEFAPVLGQLPQGLETDIREKGVNLSVGQKQRLALARGLFAAAGSDIILLDEPTSSVDLPTEEKIFRNIFARLGDKAIVATLHRLHLLPQFDRIIYLDHGRITHDMSSIDALRQPGPVRELYLLYQQKYEE